MKFSILQYIDAPELQQLHTSFEMLFAVTAIYRCYL